MELSKTLAKKNWRRTGFLNVILVLSCGIILLVFLIISLKNTGSSFSTSTIIFEGDCESTSRLNLIFHLLLNILSTGILASSNYFMQVVSAPSREELDKAHRIFHSLDIGIPSFKNMQSISHFKRICWFALLSSSLPIHLFFNSSIFVTTFQGSAWHLTIATEAFMQGADFFPPGASLAPAGSSYPAYEYVPSYNAYVTNTTEGTSSTINGYGIAVPLEQYADKTSTIRQYIAKAATNSSGWTMLDTNTCRSENLLTCKARTQYRDVVVVIETGTNSTVGWSRGEVFNLSRNLFPQWDIYVPPNDINSLWYSTECTITRDVMSLVNPGTQYCNNDCGIALGSQVIIPMELSNTPVSSNWTFQFRTSSLPGITLDTAADYGYNDKFNNLTMKHCLAEPASNVCKVGVSNLLLSVAVICIFIKVAQCCLILWRLPHSSLVTLGDAMESFISKPDPQTFGLGTLDILDSYRLETQSLRYWSSDDESHLISTIKPRQWHRPNRRFLSIMPRIVWAHMYTLLFVSITILSLCLGFSYVSNGFSLRAPFGPSNENRITVNFRLGGDGYFSALLSANIFQLLLSLCYFSYNAFFTRLLIEQEWNSYSLRPQPLRVSHPTGDQISTYRLQLPYRYSIPLLLISILCHWFLSNALFLFIIEGGMSLTPTLQM
ncbi:hypothetical protein M434DRAFT_147619 [Hypoxylon sp. CO27-5]|nr:hypothetical protein M434DRAFT_147619 [Hypoxylon sp. CO27-5]